MRSYSVFKSCTFIKVNCKVFEQQLYELNQWDHLPTDTERSLGVYLALMDFLICCPCPLSHSAARFRY